MIYILIFVWQAYLGDAPTSALSVEFKTIEACQAAAGEVRKQAAHDHAELPLLMCAQKGGS